MTEFARAGMNPLKLILRLVLSLLFWAVIVFFLKNNIDQFPDKEQFLGAFQNRAVLESAVVFLLFFLMALSLRTIRFIVLLGRIGAESRFDQVSLFLWTFFLGSVSPMRAGEAGRLVWAAKNNYSLKSVMLAWLFERGSDLLLLGGFLAAGFILTFMAWDSIYLSLCALFIVFLLLLLLARISARFIASVSGRQIRLFNRSVDLSLINAFMDKGIINKSFFLTWLIWVAMTLAFWAGYREYVPSLSLGNAILLVSVVNLSFLFALLPGNAVGYQAAVVLVLGGLAVPAEVSLASSVLFHVLSLSCLAAIGIIAWLCRQVVFGGRLF